MKVDNGKRSLGRLREVKRNTGGCGYRPQQAQRLAKERCDACRQPAMMSNPELRKYLIEQLKEKWSPEQIAGRPKVVELKRRFGDWEGDTIVSPGRRSGLATVVERKSKYLRARKTKSLKSVDTMRAANCSLRDEQQSC